MPAFLSTERLHLLLALVSALTATWWGVGTALVVVLILAARREARRTLSLRPTGPTATRARTRGAAGSVITRFQPAALGTGPHGPLTRTGARRTR